MFRSLIADCQTLSAVSLLRWWMNDTCDTSAPCVSLSAIGSAEPARDANRWGLVSSKFFHSSHEDQSL